MTDCGGPVSCSDYTAVVAKYVLRMRTATQNDYRGNSQPIQSHSVRPMTRSRSRPFNHGSSSVNIVTHCRQVHGMRVSSSHVLRVPPSHSTILLMGSSMMPRAPASSTIRSP